MTTPLTTQRPTQQVIRIAPDARTYAPLDSLLRDTLRDLIRDARGAFQEARADTTRRAELTGYAERCHAEYRELRNASVVTLGKWGAFTAN